MAKTQKFEIPKSLGACADLLYELRQKRYDAQHEAEKLKEHEAALEAHLLDKLPKGAATGIAGNVAKVAIVDKVIPVVEDWDRFYAYVAKTKSFDLLQRRTNNAAITDRFDHGVVPAEMGCNRLHDVKLSVGKV